jgi:hypothetical protein
MCLEHGSNGRGAAVLSSMHEHFGVALCVTLSTHKAANVCSCPEEIHISSEQRYMIL